MASKGIGVPFVADVKPFLKGTADIERALDDVIDSLDAVGDESKTAESVVERSLKDIGDTAETTADGMEHDFRTAFNKVEKDAKIAGSKATTGLTAETKKGKGRFAALGAELGGEFSQNIGEGISSKASGVSGAVDTVLGTLGGVLPALGPAGAVVGVGALVVGSIVQGITANAAEVAKAVQQAMSDAVDAAADILENGPKTRTLGEIIKGFTPEEKQAFKDSSISLTEAADAIKTYEDSGDPSKLDALTKPIRDRQAAINDLGMAHKDFLTGESTGPGLFDIGGPLIGDPGAQAALDSATQSIRDRNRELRDLQAGVQAIDLAKLRAVNDELRRPVYGNPYGNRRFTN